MKLSLRQNLARAILDNIEVKSWDMGSFSDDDLIAWALTILLQTKLDTISKPSICSTCIEVCKATHYRADCPLYKPKSSVPSELRRVYDR